MKVEQTMTPYYESGGITIYHGDCRDVLPTLGPVDVLISDPPWPNNAGYFGDAIPAAREVLAMWRHEALVFWTELETPPVSLPLVAVHIWHRANVNGRPYEPIYHFAPDGEKRRSDVIRTAVPFENATGSEYCGHPTQKQLEVLRVLIGKTRGTILDPFMGSGTTLVAAQNLGRRAIGIELEEKWCEVAAKRLSLGPLFEPPKPAQLALEVSL